MANDPFAGFTVNGKTISGDNEDSFSGFTVDGKTTSRDDGDSFAGFTVDGKTIQKTGEKGIGEKIKDALTKAITPIPGLASAKEQSQVLLAQGNAPLEKALGNVGIGPSPEQASSQNPYLQAAISARRAMVPLPSTQLLQRVNEMVFPTSPLDVAGSIAAPLIESARPFLKSILPPAAVEKAEIRASVMTADEVSAHLEELKRASTPGNDGTRIIKPIQSATPKETVINLGERASRTRLSSETSLLGLDQTTQASRAIVDEALIKIKSGKVPLNLEEGKQVTDWIVEGVRSGDLDASVAARYLGMPGLQDVFSKAGQQDQILFAKNIRKISSQLGFGLAQFSRIKTSLQQKLGKEAVDIISDSGKMDGNSSAYIAFNNIMRYVESFRKSMMVSNLSLAMRDMITHGARYSLNMIEDSMNGVLASAFGKIPAKNMFDAAMGDLMGLIHNLTPSGRAELSKTLDRFPSESAKLLGSPYIEIALPGKITRAINYVHNASFTFFQKASMDSFLRTRAASLGVKVNKLQLQDFQEAVNLAQKISFTQNIKYEPFASILEMYRNNPWMTAIGQTFPRMWANLLNTVYDFSPIPLLRLDTYKRMVSPDPKIAFGAFSKSMEGLAIITAGWNLGVNGHLEGKWYDLKVGSHSIDLRRWHPMAAPIVMGSMLGKGLSSFHGAISRGQNKEEAIMAGLSPLTKLSGSDWSELLLSMKRTDLSGIPVVDAILSTSEQTGPKRFKDAVLNFMGQYLQSFEPSLFTRTPLDIMGQYNREDRLPRFVRDRPISGPLSQNVPFLSRTLPVRYSPLRSELEEKDNPLLQQLTGAVMRKKTPAELEADRLGLTFKDIYPLTGNPLYDNMIAKYMGPVLEKNLGKMLYSNRYMVLEDKMKRNFFKMQVNVVKSASSDIALKDIPPDQAMEQMRKRLDKMTKEQFEEQEKEK